MSNEEEKRRLCSDIGSRDMYDAGNRKERRKRLILEILKEKGLRKLFYYSNQFGVSEATISTDLEAVEKWLNRYGLYVNRKPGSGIAIDGSEECYRKAIRAFIHENIDTEVLRQSFEQEHDRTYYESVKKSNIGKVLNDEIMQRVTDCITGIDHARMLTLTENSYAGLVRLMHGMQIQNPVLDDIKNNYPAIYEKCQRVAAVLEERVGANVPEEETGFIAVHFGAAMVRLEGKREQIRKVHVGVVCSSGIGISRLMCSKLEKVFKDRMELTAYGKNDITPYIAGKTDFFVSSIPMDRQPVPVIYVNPLLNEENMEEIRRMIYQYERIPKKQKEAHMYDKGSGSFSRSVF